MNRIVDWIFSIRLTGNTHIALRRNGKIRPQDIHRKAVAIFRVWIRTLRGLRYRGIGSLSKYEPILKIFAIYVKFSAVQSIDTVRLKEEDSLKAAIRCFTPTAAIA